MVIESIEISTQYELFPKAKKDSCLLRIKVIKTPNIHEKNTHPFNILIFFDINFLSPVP